MNVAVYDNGGKTFDRYTVILGESVFTMSENATQPDGFNQYAGEVGEIDLRNFPILKKELRDLPKPVLVAIIERLEFFK